MSKRSLSSSAPLTRVVLEHAELGEMELERPTGNLGARSRNPKDVCSWLERSRLLGVQTKQLVWELHVVQGRHQLETARLLKISRQRVWKLYTEARQDLLARAPVTDEDYIILREELKARLLATYEDACGSDDPRHLLIRLKALEQLARVQGLVVDRKWTEARKEQMEAKEAEANAAAAWPYPISAETAEKVRDYAMELLGRREDVKEAREALRRVREGA